MLLKNCILSQNIMMYIIYIIFWVRYRLMFFFFFFRKYEQVLLKDTEKNGDASRDINAKF